MAQQPSRRTLEWIKQQAEAGEGWDAARRLRTSLDDLLQNDPAASDSIPERIPLPESRDGSSTASDPAEEDGNAARPSLEAIDRDDTFILPSSIPLPPSLPPSPRQQPAQRPRREHYRVVVDRAADVFDHIKHGKVRRPTRMERTSVTLYEYYEDSTWSRVEIEDALMISRFSDTGEGLKRRLFIVEDLSERTINALGEAFGITPEFFEEHLLNSGYGGAQYDDPLARSWKTAGLKKSYVSIQWFRPVYRLPPVFSNHDLQQLLDVAQDGLEYRVGSSSISFKAETNIFRAGWDLRVDPRETTMKITESCLAERASIWRKQAENREYETVIMLLDPLPTIGITLQTPGFIIRSGNNDGTRTQPGLSDDTAEGFPIPIENPREAQTPPPGSDWLLRQRRPEVNAKTSFRVLVKQLAPRKTITIDLEKAFVAGPSMSTVQEVFNETRSTRQAVLDILHRHTETGSSSLLDLLFEIIDQDTSTLLRRLDLMLGNMMADILDDAKMEDRLALWRQLISRAEREFLEFKTSTKSFLAFFGLTLPANTSEATSDDDRDIITKVADLFKEIDKMLSRLRDTSSSLISNMGLLDSRRSIAEAHAVTRLTELAFLFIPLSFSASIFGMQVEPFKDSVPLRNFFVVAILVTTFEYMMRLPMRSQWLKNLKQSVKQRMKQGVRRYAEQHGLPVQVRSLSMLLLLQWFGYTLKGSISVTWQWVDSWHRVMEGGRVPPHLHPAYRNSCSSTYCRSVDPEHRPRCAGRSYLRDPTCPARLWGCTLLAKVRPRLSLCFPETLYAPPAAYSPHHPLVALWGPCDGSLGRNFASTDMDTSTCVGY